MAKSTERRVWSGLLIPNATVFTSSVCALVMELVAGRLVSRYLGHSLYTWTAIIGIVLTGISIGNYLGGRLADRSSSRRTLAAVFFVAAICCASVLGVNDWVGQWQALWTLSWPARILSHVFLTFLLPSVALGLVSPIVTKRALAIGLATGRTVGLIYAVGAAGAIFGTFLTGFWLVAVLGTRSIVAVVAGVLALVAAVYGLAAFLREEPNAQQHPHEQALGDPDLPWRFRDWLIPNGTVFVINLGIMALQLVAGRFIARQFGQSLYTWTTVIGVIIAGISLGNAVGGRLADRFRTDSLMTVLFVLASISCLFIPTGHVWLSEWQGLMLMPLALRVTVHVTALFLIPSTLMGAIGPVAAKLALEQGHAAGRTVGNVFAWGSVGSIVGTFLTGYYLIAAWGSGGVVCAVIGLNAFMAVLYGRKQIWTYGWAAVCAVLVVSAFIPWSGAQGTGRLLGLEVPDPSAIVYSRESQYSYITVRVNPQNPHERALVLDKLIHSVTDLSNPKKLEYPYEWVYSAVLDHVYADQTAIRALVIGGGGYSFPHYLELTRPSSEVVVAEIDPEVTEAAHAAFGFPRDTTVEVHNVDARNLVTDLLTQKQSDTSGHTFDCIFGDSINDFNVPFHLTTLEFNESLESLLAEDGLYMLNMIDVLDTGLFLSAVINTCRKTFPHVYAFCTDERFHASRDTFVVVSSKRPLDLEVVPEIIRERYPFRGRMLRPEELDAIADRTGIVLTDDYAPVDSFLAPVARLSAKDDVAAMLVARVDELLGLKAYSEALETAREAAQWRPDRPDVQGALGIAALRSGNPEAAVQSLRRSVELDLGQAPSYIYGRLAEALTALGRFDEAAGAWKEAIAADPKNPDAYISLSSTLFTAGKVQEAIDIVGEAIRIAPDSVVAHKNLAGFYFTQGNIADARTELKTVVTLNPEDADAHRDLAIVYWRLRDYDAAWVHVREARKHGSQMPPQFLEQLQRDSGRNG